MRSQLQGLVAVGLLSVPGILFGQQFTSPAHLTPSAAEILSRLREKDDQRLAALEHYESDRVYQLHYSGAAGEHHAELRVHAIYFAPGRKHLVIASQSGSEFLCNSVLRKLVQSEEDANSDENRAHMALSEKNYAVQLVREEDVVQPGSNERAWVLRVEPRDNNKFAYRGEVWVSQSDYAIMRIAGELPHSPSLWLNHSHFDYRYMRHGEVWLPERSVSSSHIRLGGQATLTIDYGAYPVVVAAPLKASGVQVASSTAPSSR